MISPLKNCIINKKHFLGYKGLRRAAFEIMKAVFLVDDAGSGRRISCEKNNNTFEWRDWQKQTAFGVMLCDDALWTKRMHNQGALG